MNLRRAISYPYRSIPKILSMVLMLGIALVAFGSMIERGEEIRGSWSNLSYPASRLEDLGLTGLLISFAGFATWLMGYGLDVIRHAGEGYKSLPSTSLFRNLANGLAFWLSRLVWGMLGTIVILDLFEPARGQTLLFDGVLFVFYLIVALESVGAAARCALLRRASAAFAFPRNLALLLANKSAFAGLIARLLLLNTAYVIANNAYVQTMTWIDRALGSDNYLIFIAILCVGVLIFLIQIMSSLHLIGQFAYRAVPVERRHRDKPDYGQD